MKNLARLASVFLILLVQVEFLCGTFLNNTGFSFPHFRAELLFQTFVGCEVSAKGGMINNTSVSSLLGLSL